jgi:hypothetical protein
MYFKTFLLIILLSSLIEKIFMRLEFTPPHTHSHICVLRRLLCHTLIRRDNSPLQLYFLLLNIQKSLVIFALSYNALPLCGNVIASYSCHFVSLLLWPYVYPLSFCIVIAAGKLVALSLLKVIAVVTLEQLSLLLVTALGILESLSLLKVTL